MMVFIYLFVVERLDFNLSIDAEVSEQDGAGGGGVCAAI